MTTPDPNKQAIIKAPSRAVAKARSNMASRALASVQETTITNSIGMKLKLIPAGEFLMGSPESEPEREDDELQHRVRITKPFYMQKTTVTQSQWMSVMGTEPWEGEYDVKEGSDYPATCVSHDDAVDFCRKLSVRENATYRLPSEAEWEYACRARSQTAYSFGDNADQLEQYAWFAENADEVGEDCDHRGTQQLLFGDNAVEVGETYAHRIGKKLPNAFGLYDMHGNVDELCSDWFDEYPSGPVTDPAGPTSGSLRVFRGGSWDDTAGYCRSAYRFWSFPSNRDNDFGFRVSLSPSGK